MYDNLWPALVIFVVILLAAGVGFKYEIFDRLFEWSFEEE